LRDRPAITEGLPQVTLEYLAHVDDELVGDRLVKSALANELVADLVGCLFTQHGAARITGQDTRQCKGHEQDADQDRHGGEQSLDDVVDHQSPWRAHRRVDKEPSRARHPLDTSILLLRVYFGMLRYCSGAFRKASNR